MTDFDEDEMDVGDDEDEVGDDDFENMITDELIFDSIIEHLNMAVLGRGLLSYIACFAPLHPIPTELVMLLLVSTHEEQDTEMLRYQDVVVQVAQHCLEELDAKGKIDRTPDGVYITDAGLATIGETTAADDVYVARFLLLFVIGPITIPARLEDYLHERDRLLPHLRHLADRLMPTATAEAGLISLVVSLYYAADGDADALEPYLRQASAIVDLVFEETPLRALSWLAQGLYRVGHLCEDAGMLDAAATAYVGVFDACDQARFRIDLATTSLFDFELDHDSWEWQIMQKAVEVTLRRGSFQTAEHIAQIVRTAVPIAPYEEEGEGEGEDEGEDEVADAADADPLLADYLDAMIAEARGDDAAARAHLQHIVTWSQSRADQAVFSATFLLPAFVSLAWMEIRTGNLAAAESLVTWATTLLDSDAVQTERPDQPDTPHDLRTLVRARLLEVRGVVSTMQGQRNDARAALRNAQRLMRLTMCATKLDIDRIQQRLADTENDS